MARPGFSSKSPSDSVFSGDHGIENQVGFYGEKQVPDMDKQTGQTPAAPDDRFTNVIGTVKDAEK